MALKNWEDIRIAFNIIKIGPNLEVGELVELPGDGGRS